MDPSEDILDVNGPIYCSSEGRLERLFIYLALNNGDQETMKDLIFPGSPVLSSVVYDCEDSFLQLLCRTRKPSIVIVQLLIDYGVDINYQNKDGNTALHIATLSSDDPDDTIVTELIKKGANKEIRNNVGLTPIEISLLEANLEIAEQFLKEEDKLPNAIEFDNIIRCQHLVKCLLQERNDWNVPSTNYSILLDFLIDENDEESFEYVVKNTTFNVNAIGFGGDTLLLVAAWQGTPRMIKALVKEGADLEVESEYLGTPLIIAIKKNRIDNVDCLLECGASVSKVENFKTETNSPLHYAVCMQNFEIVEKLVNMGADVNALTYHRSPLLLACGSIYSKKWFKQACGGLSSVFYNPDSGAFLLNNIHDFEFSIKIVEFLLDHGADVEVKNLSKRTALDQACRAGRLDAVKLLMSHGARINRGDVSSLHHAVRGENPAVVKFILEQGADVNYRCSPEKMLWVCPDYVSPPPRTPLECALNFIQQDSICKEIIEVLLEYDVKVNIVNPVQRETPLHLACLSNKGTCFLIHKSTSRPATIKLLLEHNADVNALDSRSFTPFNYALMHNHFLRMQNNVSNYLEADLLTLINFIAILIEKKEFVAKKNLVPLKSWNIRPIYQICANELSLMKRNKICETANFSFFDILSKDIDYLSGALEHKDMMDVLNTGEYKTTFPICGEYLEDRIRDATIRQEQIKLATTLFQKHVNKQMIIELMLNIFKYLNLYDLKNFLKACFVDVEEK